MPEASRDMMTGGSLPLSPAQLGVYFAHLRDETCCRYNIAQVTTIVGPFDVSLFRRAAADVIAATPALNMAIVASQDGPRQVYIERSATEIPLYDLREEPDPQAARAALIDRLTLAPFDLAADPQFRWVLIRTHDDEIHWVQVYHHVIADGWAGQLLTGLVGACYGALANDKADPKSSAEAFEAFVAHQRVELAYQGSQAASKDGTYWRDLLQGVELVAPEHGKASGYGGPFVRHSLVIEGERLAAIERLAKAHGVSAGQVLTASIALMEAAWSRCGDVVLGIPVLGRIGTQARSVVSMSSNVVHVRLRDIWSHSPGSLLREIRRQQLAALRHQRYRYEDLRRDLLGTGSDAAFARVQVNQMPFDYGIGFGDCTSETENLSNGPVEWMSLAIYPQPDGRIKIDLNGACGSFDPSSLVHAAGQILHVLDELASLPSDMCLSSLRLAGSSDVALIGA
ncbi:condensation domain-containing protein, partial [Rhizobium lemnae]